ncbi:MAG: hypothetical protein DRQ01_06355, partial [Ignavibacteriae bacterium]
MTQNLKPSVLGLKRSFGFGDRLGLATLGHMDAISGTPYLGIFAQQSIRELNRTNRQPGDVMNAAVDAVEANSWTQPWGADADHLQTREDVFRMAEAGYTFFTIDPSDYVNNSTDLTEIEELKRTYKVFNSDNKFESTDLFEQYFGETYDLNNYEQLSFNDEAVLLKAIHKYGFALKHTKNMYNWICEACQDRPFEIELSVDETDTSTTPLEHLFIGLELKR